MIITITGGKIDMTSALKEYAQMRMETLAKFVKHFEESTEVRLSLEIARATNHHKHGDVFYAEATMYLPGKNIRAEHTDSDVRVAIDIVRDTLMREITEYKGLKGHKVTREKTILEENGEE